MQKLSQKYFRVQWASGLEYTLWHWLEADKPLTSSERFTLYSLHNRAKGWIAPGDDGDPKLVATDDWIVMYEEEFDE